MSVFDRPLCELSDDELRVAAAVVAQRRDELVVLSRLLADQAAELAAERDRRRALGRQVEQGMAEAAGVVVSPS